MKTRKRNLIRERKTVLKTAERKGQKEKENQWTAELQRKEDYRHEDEEEKKRENLKTRKRDTEEW